MNKQYGLIFDVDGVIADTETVNQRVSIQVFRDLFGIEDVRPKDFTAGLGRGAQEYIKAAARVHNLNLSDQQVQRAVQLRQDMFLNVLKTESLPAYPGVLELIEATLASDEFRAAIATSSTLEKSRAVLETAKIPFKKMIYISGNDVTNKKPNPELFLLAAGRMSIKPARCVVIEDTPNGVEAAKAAGAKCIAITNTTSAEELQQADLICDSLEKINLGILKKTILQ